MPKLGAAAGGGHACTHTLPLQQSTYKRSLLIVVESEALHLRAAMFSRAEITQLADSSNRPRYSDSGCLIQLCGCASTPLLQQPAYQRLLRSSLHLNPSTRVQPYESEIHLYLLLALRLRV